MKKLVKLWRSVMRPSYRRALWRGVVAGTEHERVLRGFNFAGIVDVGANGGQFALVARHLFPQANLVAFEPLAAPAARFRAVFRNDPLVSLEQTALGAMTGPADIHVSKRDDSSSLLSMSSRQTDVFPGTEEARMERVQMSRLAEAVNEERIQTPALLKVDVQGYELEVLKGADERLYLFSHIYVECSFVELYSGQPLANEVINHLRERGFRLEGIYNTVYDRQGRAVQADFLFSASRAR